MSPLAVVPVTVIAEVVGGVDCVVPIWSAFVVSSWNMQTGRVANVTPAIVKVNRTVPLVLLVMVPDALVLPAFTATVPVTLVRVGADPIPAIAPKRFNAVKSLASVFWGIQAVTISRLAAVKAKQVEPPRFKN